MFDLYFALCKGIRIPESGKFLLVDPESGKSLLMESGIQGFGIQNRVRNGIQNPSSTEKTGIQHPESRIHGMGSRIQELSCIP